MPKKNFTYSIEKKIEKRLDHVANNVLYRSKSSIVQEAIAKWLDAQDDDWIEGYKIGGGT